MSLVDYSAFCACPRKMAWTLLRILRHRHLMTETFLDGNLSVGIGNAGFATASPERSNWYSCGTPVALRIAMVFCRQVHAGCHTKTVGSWIQIVRQQSPKSLKLWKSYPKHHQITQWISGEICGFQDLTPVMVWFTSLFYYFSTCLQPQESSMVSIVSIRWPVPRAESLTGSSEKMSSKISWLPLNFFVSTVAWCGMSFWDFLSIQLLGPPTDWFWRTGQDAGCPWSYGWSLGGHRLQISSSSLETIYMWLYDHHRTTGG